MGTSLLAVAGMLLLALGCNPAVGEANATEKFLGPERQWKDCGISLFDIHGLYGGAAVYVHGSGACIVRMVNPPTHSEKRFNLSLSAKESLALRKICIEQDFAAIQIKNHPGVPDEARPTIILRNAEGKECALAKWSNDKVERFDHVYRTLLDLTKKTADVKPDYQGDYQPDWKPPRREDKP